MTKKRSLTGFKPTGIPHLGNYLGMLRPSLELMEQPQVSCYYFLADIHALNTVQNKELLRRYSLECAASWLATGLDPERVVFFRESDVPEITRLCAILAHVTPKSVMNMAHAYKAAVAKNRELGKDEHDLDDGVHMGLYNYPLLMAADILCFDIDLVPVGKDQQQHVEIARDIARRFNLRYGEGVLKLPEPVIKEEVATIPGLDGRKMSKSYDNVIGLFQEPKALMKNINRIVTDSSTPEEPKDPASSALFDLFSGFADKQQVERMRQRYHSGIGWGEVKKELFAVMQRELAEPYQRYKELMAAPQRLEALLQHGAAAARQAAGAVLQRVEEAVGLRW